MTRLINSGLVILSLILLFALQEGNAQQVDWTAMSENTNANFYDVQKDFQEYWAGRKITRGSGYKPFKRWEAYMEPRVYPSGNMALPTQMYTNFRTWQKDNGGAFDRLRSSAGNWQELGPVGSPTGPLPYTRTGAGRVNFVRFHPTNSSIIFVGTPDGGLWKSTDSGMTWTTNTDFISVIGCSDLAIHPTNPDTMYLATGDLEGNKTVLEF